jgi:hypothetical protein
MQLNLPIFDKLKNSQNILISGAGGGFDVFAGLPLYFTLREAGKTVHLANFSFTEPQFASLISDTHPLIAGLLIGTKGNIKFEIPYYPEGYLAEWFRTVQNENVTVWMMYRPGAAPLRIAYETLIKHLGIDALILIDGGVDSIMHGDEAQPGTIVEDSITLAAVELLDIPLKLHACLGFGTEYEESVCHHHALENIAQLAKQGGFLGACALTPQMVCFQRYESACRFAWEHPNREKSHISTRVIPAVHGEFGDFRMYDDVRGGALISPLMSLYWFFDANTVIANNQFVRALRNTEDTIEAFSVVREMIRQNPKIRPARKIPY